MEAHAAAAAADTQPWLVDDHEPSPGMRIVVGGQQPAELQVDLSEIQQPQACKFFCFCICIFADLHFSLFLPAVAAAAPADGQVQAPESTQQNQLQDSETTQPDACKFFCFCICI
jgi:hypothetical protein